MSFWGPRDALLRIEQAIPGSFLHPYRVVVLAIIPGISGTGKSGSFRLLFPGLSIITVIVLGVILFASILAYVNYKPINQLFKKYSPHQMNKFGLPASNELDAIDIKLKQIIHINKNMSEEINEQLDMLKAQVLQMILSGGYADEMKPRLDMLNIHLPGPYYFACKCFITIKTDKTEDENVVYKSNNDHHKIIIQLIEQLSDENVSLYCVRDNENNNEMKSSISIIVNISEQDYKFDVIENINAVCEMENVSIDISSGRICSNLASIHISVTDANNELLRSPKSDSEDNFSDAHGDTFSIDKYDAAFTRLTNIIYTKDSNSIQSILNEIDNILMNNENSVLRFRFLTAELSSRIIKTANSMGISLNDNQVSMIILANSRSVFIDGLNSMIKEIFGGDCIDHSCGNRTLVRKAKDIQKYIEQHATDYDISLDSIADHFSMSVSGVGRQIKLISGNNFKDYLISLRIKKAKELLVETNLSVSDICKRVGYNNSSHFIKYFKREMGITPLKYKFIKEEK